MDNYLNVIKHVSLNLNNLFNEEGTLSLNLVVNLCMEEFNKYHFFKLCKEEVLKITEAYKGQARISMTPEDILITYMMNQFYLRSKIFIEDLEKSYLLKGITFANVDILINQFTSSLGIFDLTNEETFAMLEKTFNIENNHILVKDFLDYFKNYDFSFKLNTHQVIELFRIKIINLFNNLEKKVEVLFLQFDTEMNGYLDFVSFEKLLKYILQNEYENLKWKIGEFFK